MAFTDKDKNRMFELETKAKEKYIENSDWDAVIEMLDEGEQKEYWKLKKKMDKEYNL